MRCNLCGQFTDAVIVWLSQPRDDGTHAIQVPLCLKCTEQVDNRAPCAPLKTQLVIR